jgi:hypothetical protein
MKKLKQQIKLRGEGKEHLFKKYNLQIKLLKFKF